VSKYVVLDDSEVELEEWSRSALGLVVAREHRCIDPCSSYVLGARGPKGTYHSIKDELFRARTVALPNVKFIFAINNNHGTIG